MGQGKKAGKKLPAPPQSVVARVVVVAFALRRGGLSVLLAGSDSSPSRTEPGLPDALLGDDESLEEAAARVLREAASLLQVPRHLEQLRVYDAPDHRSCGGQRVITIAFLGVCPEKPEQPAEDPDPFEGWQPLASVAGADATLPPVDAAVVGDALERLSLDLEHTAVATAFFGDAFTEAQLRSVYEAVWGAGAKAGPLRLDAPNFHRAITTLSPAIMEPIPDKRAVTGGRPAALYGPSENVRTSGHALRLDRPISRPKDVGVTRRLH